MASKSSLLTFRIDATKAAKKFKAVEETTGQEFEKALVRARRILRDHIRKEIDRGAAKRKYSYHAAELMKKAVKTSGGDHTSSAKKSEHRAIVEVDLRRYKWIWWLHEGAPPHAIQLRRSGLVCRWPSQMATSQRPPTGRLKGHAFPQGFVFEHPGIQRPYRFFDIAVSGAKGSVERSFARSLNIALRSVNT